MSIKQCGTTWLYRCHDAGVATPFRRGLQYIQPLTIV